MPNSFKNILALKFWRSHPGLFSRMIAVGAGSFILYRAVLWAMAPGFWTGSFLHGLNETPLSLAQRGFGPILLERSLLQNLGRSLGEKETWDFLQQWGYMETAARLKLIIGILWVGLCITIVYSKLRRAQPCASPNAGPAAQPDSGKPGGPRSVS